MFTYPITVEHEGRSYYAYSDDFPGVYGIGKTIEEARTSILEAMRIYIRECRVRHKPVPRWCITLGSPATRQARRCN